MLRLSIVVFALVAAGATARPDDKDDLDKLFTKDSRWKGVVKEKKGGKELSTTAALSVSKRDKLTFEGTYESFDGVNVLAVEGTIEKGKVNFSFTKVEKGEGAKNILGVKVKGTLAFDSKTKKPTITATYEWPDANNPKIVAKGSVTLKLEE